MNDLDLGKVKSISIINTNGLTVYQSGDLSRTGINIRSLPTGLYMIKIMEKNGNMVTSKKIVTR